MLKGLNGPGDLHVVHACSSRPREQFRDLLRGQFVKHAVWLVADAGLTVVAVAFSPFLVPIPGPNVILYYPALRLLSHYRAMTGTRKALAATARFEESMELEQLENSLRSGHKPERACAGAGLRVNGLQSFLERM
jgi:hypothetical protein